MKVVVSGVFAVGMLLLAGCGGSEAQEESCYSPQQNVSRAYEAGMVGCACDKEQDQAVCVTDSASNRKVALECSGPRWQAVEDGPCMPPLP